MRGCLSVLILAIAFLVVGVWFGGPPLASAIVRSTLSSTGFASDTLAAEVTADPPFTLAVGRARSVAITAPRVPRNRLRLATLPRNLGSADLRPPSAATAHGHC